MNYSVEDLYKKYKGTLGLKLLAGKEKGLLRQITSTEVHQPGLCLSGYWKGYAEKAILIFGKSEIEYLRELPPSLLRERLEMLLSFTTPALFLTHSGGHLKELTQICEEKQLPLFQTSLETMDFLLRLTSLLREDFTPLLNCHATLLDIFGVGVLIQGDPTIGKSEAALGLLAKGHRLVSDDLVKVKKQDDGNLIGFGIEASRFHMVIRGIGIINVANLYGATAVLDKKSLDIVVKLEVWDDNCFYDRAGLEEASLNILGVILPYHILPVKPGRDIVLLLETLALNHRLKTIGCHSAKEFNTKLQTLISRGQAPHLFVAKKSILTRARTNDN